MRWTGLLAALLLAACGGSSGPPCTNISTACPTPPPSYAATVSGIIQNRCLQCHAPGGQEASMPFTTYQQVFSNRAAILTQVYACRMPPEGATPLSDTERQTLVSWLGCGSPNN